MQDLEELGRIKIAEDISKLLEPLSEYLLMRYNIELKEVVLSRTHEQIPVKLAQPQGYVEFKVESKGGR